MTLSIYHAALEYSKGTPDSLFENMSALTAGLFEPIWTDASFTTMEVKAKVLMYIIHGYTVESPAVILGVSGAIEKKNWFGKVGLPEFMWADIVLLKNKTVRDVIIAYLDFQGDRDFTHLKIKKMQYDEMMSATVSNTKNDSGDTDYGLLFKITEMADKLRGDIESLEEKIKAKYEPVFKNRDEINGINAQQNARNSNSINVETSHSIRKNK
jgi:hypothetical protein